ncbi:hypothetical protein KAFR_0B03720 [Kazachstania africana CBS 2517]|uniref:Uncharacterized protein n=1 Tax=Kazachstania africana (strain ATCC 22294 / BCRC 22015 / CBS 2517 / CECT 1963 / NBRC 1671 / NRRL Y-8276) TaxID=1071382 RepID=H2AQL8_KAZAF|nr:hypothetical protein KAFR_0B03720 [Kazachstania africana CBS 2517]CCF56668.1 hypothetical protein KAFR_0B03720 [Kazachstania africana CBS 2517]
MNSAVPWDDYCCCVSHDSIKDGCQFPDKIVKLCIYDFDNTLYNSPKPNQSLYGKSLFSALLSADTFYGGGWWNNTAFLSESFSESMRESNKESMSKYWNKNVVEKARISYADSDTISVLLSGRKDHFQRLIYQMLTESREKFGLSDDDLKFNCICLKKASINGEYPTTMDFKRSLLMKLINFFKNLREVVIFEDRINHVNQFNSFFKQSKFSKKLQCSTIHVQPTHTKLDPAAEVNLVERLVEIHNRNNPEMDVSLKWSSARIGFFLNSKSLRSLSMRTKAILKGINHGRFRAYSENNMFIPIAQRDSPIRDAEIVKIWTNNEKYDNELAHGIIKNFYSLHGTEGCKVQFLVIQVGYSSGDKTSRDTEIYYKAIPCDKKRYLWSAYRDFIIVNDIDSESPQDKLNKIKWERLRNPVKITTYFRQHSKLKM